MTWREYGGKSSHPSSPCAGCGMPSTHWFPDGSPAWPKHEHRKPYYEDELVTLYHADSRAMADELPGDGVLVLDPPFDAWADVAEVDGRTVIAFTSWQHRHHVEARFGKPRAEIVWATEIGRWVSHNLPLTAHETILVYGPTGDAYVGDPTDGIVRDKGSGSVGRDKYPTRTYTPRDRRALTSVMTYPRDPRADLGLWQKPLTMVQRLIEWTGGDLIVDPYAGSGTSLVAAKLLGKRAIGVEIDEQTCEIAARRCSQEVLGLPA